MAIPKEGTHRANINRWLRTHPGPHARKAIAVGVGLSVDQLSTLLTQMARMGDIQHAGSPRSGLWEAVDTQVVAVNGEADAPTNGMPETLNFHVVGLLSDNRLVLEFKKTRDVFVAKRVDV